MAEFSEHLVMYPSSACFGMWVECLASAFPGVMTMIIRVERKVSMKKKNILPHFSGRREELLRFGFVLFMRRRISFVKNIMLTII